MRRLRKHLTREEVNDEERDLEMADSVADKHTDGNRNYDGSDIVYGVKVKKMGLPKCLAVSFDSASVEQGTGTCSKG